MNFYRSCIASANDFAPSYSALVNNNIFQTSFENAFAGQIGFNSAVVVGNNVINCTNAFRGCTNFNQPVRFEDSPEEMKCNSMFAGCTKFNAALILNRPITKADNMFAGCANLRNGISVNGDVLEVSGMYSGCISLVSGITVNGNVINAQRMFAGAAIAGGVPVTGNIINASDMFTGSGVARSVTATGLSINANNMFNRAAALIENINIQTVDDGGNMFRDCGNLQGNINIKFNVVDMPDNIFSGCTALNHDIVLTGIPNYDGSGMFANHPSLNKNIMINNANNCYMMFYGCSKLFGNVSVGAAYTKNCQLMFAGCSNLDNVTVENVNDASYMFSASGIPRGAIVTGSSLNAAFMYNGCLSLIENVSHQNVADANNMFAGCSQLNGNISIALFESGKIANIFAGCASLNHDIVITGPSSYNGSEMFRSLANLNRNILINNANNCVNMFYGCSKLAGNISVGAAFRKNCVNMFYGCSSLISAEVDNISDASYMFKGCSNLTGVTLVNMGVVSGAGMFEDCTVFNQMVSGTFTNYENMFNNCKSFNQNVILPNTVSTFRNMFRNCSNLVQTMVVPKVSGDCHSMFAGCNNLTDVVLPCFIESVNYNSLFIDRDLTTWLNVHTFYYENGYSNYLRAANNVSLGRPIAWSAGGTQYVDHYYYNEMYKLRFYTDANNFVN